jgi:hypothetical protein
MRTLFHAFAMLRFSCLRYNISELNTTVKVKVVRYDRVLQLTSSEKPNHAAPLKRA